LKLLYHIFPQHIIIAQYPFLHYLTNDESVPHCLTGDLPQFFKFMVNTSIFYLGTFSNQKAMDLQTAIIANIDFDRLSV
jgi:hypothetical protein